MSTETARLLWSVLAEASVRAAVAAALAAAILFVTRTRVPAVRHAVWAGVTAAMLAMPLLPRAVPPVAVAALPPMELWTPAPLLPVVASPIPVSRPVESNAAVSPTRAAAAREPAPSPAQRWSWLVVAAVIYLAGLFASLVYVTAGWLAMTAVVRRARRVALPDGTAAYESPMVAAPLTAGIVWPRIILPCSWREWPDDTLRAVLAHERTHVRRGDPLVALMARLNRCVFWFHPLAWWLESRLAVAAEFACDEAAARTCAPASYARALVDMADEVRRHGGRIAWQGIGASGTGRLTDRIDRILRGSPWPSISRRKKMAVAASCAAAIAVAVACRPAARAETLQPDPAVTEREARERARQERWRTARAMTPQEVAQLESAVAQEPGDLDARDRLLLYSGDPERTLDAAGLAARRAHVLWTIEHHPGSELAGSWGMRINTTNQDRNPDRAGYEQAKRLWQAQTARADAPVAVFVNAARFFEVADKPLAEENYLKAQAREPRKYSGALGRLYALTIMGSDASMPLNVLRHVSMAQAHSPYADRVRQTLAASTDAVLLSTAGQYLIHAHQFNTMGKTAGSIDFDVEAEGVRHLERAVQVDANNAHAAALLARHRGLQRHRLAQARLKVKYHEATSEQVAMLSETDRLELLPELISLSYSQGERLNNEYKAEAAKAANREEAAKAEKKHEAAKAAWNRATAYANDAIAIAPRHPDHARAGSAQFDAHMCLGTIALWNGDVKTAVAHLQAAPGAPPSEELKYGVSSQGSHRLVKYLLKAGEHEAVAQFYDRMAKVDLVEGKYYAESAQSIRAGRMPSWYQITEARESGR